MNTIAKALYGRYLVPYGHDDLEYLLDQLPLVGYPDCHAINALIVVSAPAASTAAARMVRLVGTWNAAGPANPIVRAEFLFHPGTETRLGLRGAVLYDSSQQPVMHFVNALIGYDGSGFLLSRSILRALGVHDAVIDLLNDNVRDRYNRQLPFVVIVEQRQTDKQWQWQLVTD